MENQTAAAAAGQKGTTRNYQPLKFVEGKGKRSNMKGKRRRNFLKKAIELEKMFDLDICIVIKDRETDKFFQYMGGSEEQGLFDIE